MKGFIAVDGGGSKTELVLCNESGNVLHHEVISCTNPNDIGIEESLKRLETSLKNIINFAKERDLDLACILLAIAGVEFGDLTSIIEEKLQDVLGFEKIVVTGDLASVIELTLSNLDTGVVIISGTGFNMAFKNDGEFTTVGGWGYIPDNYLSGFDLGKDALIACSKSIDRVAKKTCLVEMLEKHYGNRLWYAMEEVYKAGIKGVASLSKYVIEGYTKNDMVCKTIIDTRIENLSNIIKTKTLNTPTNIYLCGGIFENNSCIVEKLKSCLKGYDIEISRKKTIYGAVSLAKKECKDFKNKDFYLNFDHDYKEIRK